MITLLAYFYLLFIRLVNKEVERWPHTPNAVGSNPSAAVDCLP